MSKLDTISVDISVVLGTAVMPVHQLLRMGRGAVIELNTSEDDDVQILANKTPVARGEVVLRGERIGISITELLLRAPEYRPQADDERL